MSPKADAIIPVFDGESEPRAAFERVRDAHARLRGSPLPRVLFATHDRRGGVQRHIEDLARLLDESAEALLLRPYRKSYVSVAWMRPGERFELWFHAGREWDRLVDVLRSIGVARVHIHHVHGLPQAVLGLAARLGVPCDLTLHDYYPICPQYQLTDASRRYCGEPDAGGCRRCLEGYPVQWPLSIDEWRAAFRPLIVGDGRLIAPSSDTAERIRRYFPEAAPVVWPHAEFPSGADDVPFKILVPGGISPSKGFSLLEGCVRDAHARGLPLHFRVLGYIALPLPLFPALPLSVTGEFPEGALEDLIALERGDAFLFPAQWPETYSYTLSAALATGRPIVATDLGAFPERLAGYVAASIVHWRESPQAFNDALLGLLSGGAMKRARLGGAYERLAAYRERYVAVFRGAPARAASPMPPVDAIHLSAPEEDVAQPTLRGLFEDGVLCGSGASLAELGQRTRAADVALSKMEIELGERQLLAARLSATEERLREADRRVAEGTSRLAEAREAFERATADAETRVSAFETSTSWRLTAPLRALARLLRGS